MKENIAYQKEWDRQHMITFNDGYNAGYRDASKKIRELEEYIEVLEMNIFTKESMGR